MKKTTTLSKVMTSGLLMAVGIVTIGLLSIGMIQKTQTTDENLISPSAGIMEMNANSLDRVEPATGVRLYEDHTETVTAPVLKNLPPQPVPVE